MGDLQGPRLINPWTPNLLSTLHVEGTSFLSREGCFELFKICANFRIQLAVVLAVDLNFLAIPGNLQCNHFSRELSNYLNLSEFLQQYLFSQIGQ